MTKKFYDIFPPPKSAPPAASITRARQSRAKGEDEDLSSSPLQKSEKVILPKIQATGFPIKIFIPPFLILMAGIFCYFRLSQAKIEIWPETDFVNFQLELAVNATAEKIDVLNKIIPLKVFEAEKTVSGEFPSSGKKSVEKKAEGIIRIYNAYSTQNQILMATTRFLSADGKLFRTPDQVTIPGGYYEKGKLVPGQIDIKVVADQPGPEYNIGPTTFSIPGFAGTERYTKFYAKSFQPMQGGEKKEVAQVLKEDIDKAKNTLFEKVKVESEAALKEKISPEFIFFPGEVATEILDSFSVARPGAEMEKFILEVKAKSKTLSFKKEDLENFVKGFIETQISPEKKLYSESLKINQSVLSSDLKTGKIIINLDLEAKIYSDIDQTALKEALLGKSLAESKMFLENQPQIVEVSVEFWPFWVKKAPKETEKIKINLHI